MADVITVRFALTKSDGENPDDEDEEVDYSISWIEGSDGEFSAEVRPQ